MSAYPQCMHCILNVMYSIVYSTLEEFMTELRSTAAPFENSSAAYRKRPETCLLESESEIP